MATPNPHDSDNEDEIEIDPTMARLDLLTAYTMLGRLNRDGLLSGSATARVEEAMPVVEPPEDERYFYKEPGETAWRAA